MNILLFNKFGLDNYYNITKLYLYANNDLLTNTTFLQETFENACIKSNLNLIKYLINKSPTLLYSFDSFYLNSLFNKMCANSNLETIQWYIDNFNLIDKYNNNFEGLKLACITHNFLVFKWLYEQHNNIPQYICENMFKTSLLNSNLSILRFIFNKNPNINLNIINDMILPSTISSSSINNIFEWLKNITINNNYTLRILEHNQIQIIDNVVINKSKIIKPYCNIEIICQLCMENPNTIISNCHHVFCYNCIRQWIRKNNSCPYCRNSDIIEFYYI